MAFKLTWLADVLKAAGLKVAEQPGWQTRGRGDVGNIKGIITHHTAGSKTGNAPSLGIVTNGRSDLPGPLSQLVLGRDGTFYVVAAGKASHAGKGNWQGVTDGNTSMIGIEAENTGLVSDPWPDVQMDAYRRGAAAILTKIGAKSIMVCGHREYATPKGRKIDPIFDMDDFRAGVRRIMEGVASSPVLIPAADAEGRPTLRWGSKGELVKSLQAAIGTAVNGEFWSVVEAAVREFQRKHGLVPDGIVGPKTWKFI